MLNILIIDDDKLIRWSLKQILSQEGHHVDVVSNLDDALKQVEKNSFHLVFIDFEIEDENCLNMLKKLQESHPETQIIILSSQSQNQVEHQIAGIFVNAIIEKPFDSHQIRDLTLGIMDKKNSEKTDS